MGFVFIPVYFVGFGMGVFDLGVCRTGEWEQV